MGCGTTKRNVSSVQVPEQVLEKVLDFPETTIYFGSQTGNSERFAKELLRDAKEKYNFKARLTGLEKFDPYIITQQKLALFVVSTYGEGGPTDNAQEFYKWLKAEEGRVEGLRFAVFGCGDSSSENSDALTSGPTVAFPGKERFSACTLASFVAI